MGPQELGAGKPSFRNQAWLSRASRVTASKRDKSKSQAPNFAGLVQPLIASALLRPLNAIFLR